MQGRCASVGITASHSGVLVYTLSPIPYLRYPVLHEHKVSTVSHTKRPWHATKPAARRQLCRSHPVFRADLPSGPAIVLVAGFICFLSLALGPVGGLIWLVLAPAS